MKALEFGSFEEYKETQVRTHLAKISYVWFCGLTASPLFNICTRLLKNKKLSIVCMGSRNGVEPRLLAESGFIRALGLDIAPTANAFPYMMQHDFHELKPKYISSFDVLYSNSYDHAHSIDRFLVACKSFLHEKSIIIFDYSPSGNALVNGADCLSISLDELVSRVHHKINYQLIAKIRSDQRLKGIWQHYEDCDHLIFASKQAIKNLPEATQFPQIFNELERLHCDQSDIESYFQKLYRYTKEHLDYVASDMSNT